MKTSKNQYINYNIHSYLTGMAAWSSKSSIIQEEGMWPGRQAQLQQVNDAAIIAGNANTC